MNSSVLALLFAAVLAWQVDANPAVEDGSEDAIARAVQELGDAEFAVRKAATRFLWAQGPRAEAALHEAARSPELEVRLRAQRILRDFEYGILPGVPREVVELIGQFRSGDAAARRRAVLVLLEMERFDTVVHLIGLEADAESRRQLLVLLFDNRAAMELFATAKKIEALVELVASDQDDAWRRTAIGQLLFSAGMVERLAENGQLETLTNFLKSEDDGVVRSQVLNSVFGKPSTLAIVLKHGDLPLLFTLIDAAPDEAQRAGLLTRLLDNPEVIKQVLSEDKLDDVLTLLEQSLDGPRRRDALARLFQSGAMSLLLEHRDVDQLVEWLRQEKDAELRGQLLAALMSARPLQQKLASSGRTKVALDIAADEPQTVARRAYLEALLQNGPGVALNDRETRLGLWRLINSDEDASWRAGPLAKMLRSSDLSDIFAEAEEAESLLETVRAADAAGRVLFEALLNHQQALASLLQNGHFDALREVAQNGEDHERGRWLAQLVRHAATAEYLNSTNQLPRLIEMARDESSPAARQAYLQALITSHAAVTSLINEGHYDAVSELVLEIEDAMQRATLFGQFAQNSAVTQHLQQQDQLDTLVEFAEAQETAEMRAAFLQPLFSSQVLSLLLQRGHYDQLLAYVDEQGAANHILAATFYTNPAVLDRLVERQQTAQLISRIEAMDAAGRGSFLQRLLYNRQLLPSLATAGHLDSLLALIASEPSAVRRGSYLGALLGSPEVVKLLASQEKLETAVAIIRAEEDARARRTILQQVLGNSSILGIWVRSDMLDPLLDLLHEQDDPRMRGDLLARVATSAAVVDQWAKEDRLSTVLTMADSFGRDRPAGDARRNYLARVFSDRNLVQKLIKNDLYEDMLQIATRDPQPSSRSALLRSLVLNPATADYLKSENQLPQLLSIAWDEPSEQVRYAYLQGLVTNSAAVTSLVDAGLYNQSAELVLEIEDAVQRATLFGMLARHHRVAQHLQQQNQIDALLEFADDQPTLEARHAFLQSIFSSHSLTLLIQRGHYDRLRRYLDVDAPSRDALAANFYANAVVLERVVEAKEIEQLIAHAKALDAEARPQLLQRLVHQHDVLGELTRSGHFDALVSLIQEESDASRRSSLLGSLLASPNVVEQLASQKKLARVLDVVRAEKDADARQRVVAQLFNNNDTIKWWVNSEMLEPLIELVISDSGQQQHTNQLGRLVTMPAVLEQWAKNEQQLASVLAFADLLGEKHGTTAQREYLHYVFGNSNAVRVLIEGGFLDRLLKIVDGNPDSASRARMLQPLLQNPATAARLAKQGQLERLVEIVRRQTDDAVRRAGVAGIVGNEAAVSALVDAGQFEPLVELCRQEPDEAARRKLKTQLLMSPRAVKYLADQEELTEHVQAVLSDPDPTARHRMFAQLVTRPGVPKAIDQAGMFDELIEALEAELEGQNVTHSPLLQMGYSKELFELLVDHDRTPLVVALLTIEPDQPIRGHYPAHYPGQSSRHRYLSGLLGHPKVLRAVLEHEPLSGLLEDIETAPEPYRGNSLWRTAVGSPEVIAILAEHGQLDRLFTDIADDPQPFLKQQLSMTLLRPESHHVLEQSDVALRLVSLVRESGAHPHHWIEIQRLLSHSGLRQTLIARGEGDTLLDLLPLARESDRDRFRREILFSPSGLVSYHLNRGDAAAAEKIIQDQAGEGDEARLLLATLLLSSGDLQRRISELQQQVAGAADSSGGDLRTLVYLHRAAGDLDAAGSAAEQTGDAALVHAITLERRDWRAAAQQLAAEDLAPPIPLPRSQANEARARVERLGRIAAYWRLAGEMERSAEVLDQIERIAEDGGQAVQWDCAEALLLNDRVQAGLKLLDRSHPLQAFDLRAARQEYGVALNLVHSGIDASFDSDWYATLPQKNQPNTQAYQGKQRLELAMRIARVLQRLGRTDDVDKIIKLLEAHAQQQPEMENHQDLRRLHWQWLATQLYQMGMYPRAWQAAEHAIKPLHESTALGNMFTPRGNEATAWWSYFRRVHGEEPVQKTLARVHRVLHPVPADSLDDFERMVESATNVDAGESQQLPSLLTGLADTCVARGRFELAQRLLEQVPNPQRTTWVKRAKTLGQLGHHREAAEAWLKVWELDRDQLDALYQSGAALVDGGDVEEGEKRKQQANQSALESSARHRMALALHREGLSADAEEQWTLVTRTAPMDHWQWNDAVRLLGDRAHQRQDHQAAADHWEQYVLTNLRATSALNEGKFYLRLPYMIREHRAIAAAAERDCEAAVEQAELALAALPGQTSLVEELVPQLQQLECRDAADALFARTRQHYQTALVEFSTAAELHNNLAWLNARCHRHLDEALEHARRAVALQPRNAGYVDTLAEVHFHRGDRDEAIRLSERSVSLAPGNAKLQDQLERFRTAPLPSI